MSMTFQDGSFQYEILGHDDSILEFKDPAAALNYLRHLRLDASQLAILRGLFAVDSPSIQRMDREEVLNWVAHLFVAKRLKILKSFRQMTGGNDTEGTAKEGTGVKGQEAPRKRSWIEIYLHDAEGHPIPRERYRIRLPDGSVEEGNLDASGYAEYYEINPGSCEVTFPDLDAHEWTRG